MKRTLNFILLLIVISSCGRLTAQSNNFVKENFKKIDTTITMRDGVKLYTIIYIPKDQSQQHAFLMERTPYSVAPYGEDQLCAKPGSECGINERETTFSFTRMFAAGT